MTCGCLLVGWTLLKRNSHLGVVTVHHIRIFLMDRDEQCYQKNVSFFFSTEHIFAYTVFWLRICLSGRMQASDLMLRSERTLNNQEIQHCAVKKKSKKKAWNFRKNVILQLHCYLERSSTIFHAQMSVLHLAVACTGCSFGCKDLGFQYAEIILTLTQWQKNKEYLGTISLLRIHRIAKIQS